MVVYQGWTNYLVNETGMFTFNLQTAMKSSSGRFVSNERKKKEEVIWIPSRHSIIIFSLPDLLHRLRISDRNERLVFNVASIGFYRIHTMIAE